MVELYVRTCIGETHKLRTTKKTSFVMPSAMVYVVLYSLSRTLQWMANACNSSGTWKEKTPELLATSLAACPPLEAPLPPDSEGTTRHCIAAYTHVCTRLMFITSTNELDAPCLEGEYKLVYT